MLHAIVFGKGWLKLCTGKGSCKWYWRKSHRGYLPRERKRKLFRRLWLMFTLLIFATEADGMVVTWVTLGAGW